MAFFRNRAVNLLNFHYGIHAIAISGGGAFFLVFLLRAGVPLPGVLVSMAAILLGRFLIRPAIVPAAIRWGLRPLVIAGTFLGALQYLVLPFVHGVAPPLFLLIAVVAFADTIYWTTYHAYFAAQGDDQHRGHQTGMREAIAAGFGIVSPIVTGWGLVRFGPGAAFGITAVCQTISALPLFWTPEVAVAAEVPGAWRAARSGVKLFLADGWIGSGWVMVWQMALFISLGESFVTYGGALAIAALVGACIGLYLGRQIDAGRGGKAVMGALGPLALVMLLRAASPGHAGLAVVANAFASVGSCLYVPTLMTAMYNQAKRSPCLLRFHVAAEGGWDVGGSSGCLVAALMLSLGAPMTLVLLLPLAGVAAVFVQLRSYYAVIGGAVEPV